MGQTLPPSSYVGGSEHEIYTSYVSLFCTSVCFGDSSSLFMNRKYLSATKRDAHHHYHQIYLSFIQSTCLIAISRFRPVFRRYASLLNQLLWPFITALRQFPSRRH